MLKDYRNLAFTLTEKLTEDKHAIFLFFTVK